ncbi:MAG: leucyl/phenylalanyl-tRNA--protein transferase [Phycisphaerales bacterium]|jgi:leucyl/phenylalanyl-tRNA--protein transferase
MAPNDFSTSGPDSDREPDPAQNARSQGVEPESVPPHVPANAPDAALIEALIGAYSQGYFPMADPEDGHGGDGGAIGWYDPDPRGIIPIVPGDPAGEFRVSKNLAQRVRSARFTITSDQAFSHVIRACGQPRPAQGEDSTWIDGRIIGAYEQLHAAGHAHSVEAWTRPDPKTGSEPRLVGGLYGVSVGGLFAGESMFSRPDLGGTDASKVCLVHLVEHLRRRGYTLLDTQMTTEHIARFGGVEIPRAQYQRRLAEAVEMDVEWGVLDADTMRL